MRLSIRFAALEAFGSLAASVDDPAQAAVLLEQADVLLAGATEAGLQKTDLKDLEERQRAVVEAGGRQGVVGRQS